MWSRDEDEVSVHDTKSDESADSTLENVEIENTEQHNREANSFYGKNRYKWAKTPPSQSRVRAHNIILHLPGLRGLAREKNKMTPLGNVYLLMIFLN
ncbi:unnamed protein product [Euphydryas editha]|uniref:Uncharacterized protein n=1 Tax=Euphydryas editha TaxID=104508 RepID=A0AAU9V4F0_EUPED|nr:unnamed protein product [Euphydryas editha]